MADINQSKGQQQESVRLNITASDLRTLLERENHHRPRVNRRLERIIAARNAPRHWCHFAYIYPYPSLRPTW